MGDGEKLDHTLMDRRLVDDALAELAGARPGQPSGPNVLALVKRLQPIMHFAVLRAVLAYGKGRALANAAVEIEDLVQNGFSCLFADRGRLLRIWDPAAGMLLPSWVGRIGGLRTRDVLRARNRDPWLTEAKAPEHFETQLRSEAFEDRVIDKMLWEKLRKRVLENLSEKGTRMFGLLFEEDLDVAEIRKRHPEMSADAIYQWKKRLNDALRADLFALMSEDDEDQRKTGP